MRHCSIRKRIALSCFGDILTSMNISRGSLHRLSSGVTGFFAKLSSVARACHDGYAKRLMK